MELTSRDTGIACIIVVAFLIVFIYTAFFNKHSKLQNDTMEEFAVGSRKFGFFVVLCTLLGVFLPASAYIGWFSWGVWEGLIAQYLTAYGMACFFVMYVFSARIWVWGKKFNLVTQPDFTRLRFRSKPLTMLNAVTGVFVDAPWVIIEMAALGWVTNAVTGGIVPNWVGVVFFMALTIAYTSIGGIKSVASVEVLKGVLVITVVIIGAVVLIIKNFGGFGTMFEELMAAAPQNMTFNTGGVYPYSYWSSIVLTGTIGCFGWVSMFARIYTAKSVVEVKKSASSGTILMVILGSLLLILAASGFVTPGVQELPDPNYAIFYLFQSGFGPVALGIVSILVIITAIGLSGMAINAHSIIIANNIIREIKPGLTDLQRRRYARIAIVIYGIIAAIIASIDLPNLATIAITFYELVVQIIPLILFGIFWRRANKWSVGVGYVVGLAIGLILGVIVPEGFPWMNGWTGGIFGLIVNVIINIVLGLAIKKEDYVDELFDVVNAYKEDAHGNVISEAPPTATQAE